MEHKRELNTWTLTDGTPKEAKPKTKGFLDYKEEVTHWLKSLGIRHYYADLFTVDYTSTLHEEFKNKTTSQRAAVNALTTISSVYNKPHLLDYGPSLILSDPAYHQLCNSIIIEV